jgi:hypothetical protein
MDVDGGDDTIDQSMFLIKIHINPITNVLLTKGKSYYIKVYCRLPL